MNSAREKFTQKFVSTAKILSRNLKINNISLSCLALKLLEDILSLLYQLWSSAEVQES
jgi:hypothetical protein